MAPYTWTPGRRPMHPVDILQVSRRGRDHAAYQSVRLALAQQHGADERRAPAHLQLGILLGDAVAAREPVVLLPILPVARILLGIDDRHVLADSEPQPVACDGTLDHGGTPDEDGRRQPLVDHDLRRAQHALVLAFGVDDPAALRAGILRAAANIGAISVPL